MSMHKHQYDWHQTTLSRVSYLQCATCGKKLVLERPGQQNAKEEVARENAPSR